MMRSFRVMTGLAVVFGLLALAGGGWLVYNAGLALGTATSGASVPSWLTVLGGIFVFFLLMRLIFPLIFMPIFGFGGRRFGHHGKFGHYGWKSWARHKRWDRESGVPPFFQEWHEKAHQPDEPEEV